MRPPTRLAWFPKPCPHLASPWPSELLRQAGTPCCECKSQSRCQYHRSMHACKTTVSFTNLPLIGNNDQPNVSTTMRAVEPINAKSQRICDTKKKLPLGRQLQCIGWTGQLKGRQLHACIRPSYSISGRIQGGQKSLGFGVDLNFTLLECLSCSSVYLKTACLRLMLTSIASGSADRSRDPSISSASSTDSNPVPSFCKKERKNDTCMYFKGRSGSAGHTMASISSASSADSKPVRHSTVMCACHGPGRHENTHMRDKSLHTARCES